MPDVIQRSCPVPYNDQVVAVSPYSYRATRGCQRATRRCHCGWIHIEILNLLKSEPSFEELSCQDDRLVKFLLLIIRNLSQLFVESFHCL